MMILQENIEEGIVEEVTAEQIEKGWVGYISPVSMVPKKGGEWRMIWDGRVVNGEQVNIHFRMESPLTVQRLMRKDDWATSLDLKSAFSHVRVNECMRPFLCFRHKERVFSYKGMPFGSKHSPRLFTEALGFAIAFIRAHWDIRLVVYMDDLLLLHQDPRKLEIYTLQIAAYLQWLGWTLSVKKCVFRRGKLHASAGSVIQTL
jgi:hypothetical protein